MLLCTPDARAGHRTASCPAFSCGYPPPPLPLHVHLQGFIRPSSRAIVVSAATPADLIDKLAAYKAPPSLIRLASQGKLGVHERG